MQGGNAIDAAVAAAATLNVVEPMIPARRRSLRHHLHREGEQAGCPESSGKAPSGATLARYDELGYRAEPRNWGPGSGMPGGGILTVTVPGSVWGWQEVLDRFGKLSFKEVLEPAIDYADNGFPVSRAHRASNGSCPPRCRCRSCCTELDPDSVKTWYIDGSRRSPARSIAIPIWPRRFA